MSDAIVLTPEEYWQLKALIYGVTLARTEAQQIVARAAAAHDAHVTRLSEKYGIALGTERYRLQDATCTLERA